MKNLKVYFVFVVLLLVVSITGCANDPTPTTEPPAVTHAYPPPMNDPEEVAASLTKVPDEETVAPPEETTDPEPTDEVVTEPQVDNCVECHTNQQSLIDTANPVVEVVSENEGEG